MAPAPVLRRALPIGLAALLLAPLAATASATTDAGGGTVDGPPVAARTERVSAAVGDVPLTDGSVTDAPVVSADGRFVAFVSDAQNLVPGGPSPTSDTDVYVVDRLLGTTEQVSVSSDEEPGTLTSDQPSISDDGRFVAFQSEAPNLVTGDTNSKDDVFVRDRVLGTTERVSVDDAEGQLTNHSFSPDLSGDGRRIAFVTYLDLDPGDTNGTSDVYVRDRIAGTTVRASLDAGDAEVASPVKYPALDRDGSVVGFASEGAFVADDTNGLQDIFVRDLVAGTTVRASEGAGGIEADGASELFDLSSTGRFVAFDTAAGNLGQVTDHVAGRFYVYRRDLLLDVTRLVSATKDGTIATRAFEPSISADGRRVVFKNRDGGLLPNMFCEPNIALRDLPSGELHPVFPRTNGGICGSRDPAISADGRYVVGEANDSLLVVDDPDVLAQRNVYLRIFAANAFDDVLADHPFFEAISWLADEDITGGFADGGFHPTDTVTRQAIAAFVYRFSGSPAFVPPGTATFGDVGTTHPFFDEIEWLVDTGLAGGYADGGYHPTASVSRQAIAAFLYRLAGEPAFVPPVTPTFTDVGTTHPFFDEIEWLAAQGLAGGYADGGFHPTAPVSRQAGAAFLFRYDRLGL